MTSKPDHLAAIRSGYVTKTNVIGIRKALNADDRRVRGYSVSHVAPKLQGEALNDVLREIDAREPWVTGELRDTGLALLANRRYRRQLENVAAIAADVTGFRLVGFTDDTPQGGNVAIFRACTDDGRNFTFTNVAWQSGGNGPEVREVNRHPCDPYTFERDGIGGAILTRTRDGANVYFQPGDDANEAADMLGSYIDPVTADAYLEGAPTGHIG